MRAVLLVVLLGVAFGPSWAEPKTFEGSLWLPAYLLVPHRGFEFANLTRNDPFSITQISTNITRIFNTTGGGIFFTQRNVVSQLLPNGGTAYVQGPQTTFETTIATFQGASLVARESPCSWWQNGTTRDVMTAFTNNVSLSFDLRFDVEFVPSLVADHASRGVPQYPTDFFTFVHTTSDHPAAETDFSLLIRITANNKEDLVGERFANLTVSMNCTAPVVYDLSKLASAVSTWEVSVSGVKDIPIIISLVTSTLPLQAVPEFTFYVETGPPAGGGDTLEVWQIVLIAIGGAAALLLVVSLFVVAGLWYFKWRSPYEALP
jgi:hypothetical protein